MKLSPVVPAHDDTLEIVLEVDGEDAGGGGSILDGRGNTAPSLTAVVRGQKCRLRTSKPDTHEGIALCSVGRWYISEDFRPIEI